MNALSPLGPALACFGPVFLAMGVAHRGPWLPWIGAVMTSAGVTLLFVLQARRLTALEPRVAELRGQPRARDDEALAD